MTAALHLFAASSAHIAVQRVETSWTWYVIRASGFVAAGLLVLLMLSGIGQVTGILYRFMEPIKAWALHRAMALALCASIVVHVGFLLIDKFMPFSLVQVLVPFASHYNNHTTLWGMALGGLGVSLGVLAMYGVAILVLTSLRWIDTKKRAWRQLHYISYAVMLFVFLHALYVGADLKYGLFRQAWVALFCIVLLGVVARLWRAGTMKKDRDNERSSR